MNDNRDYKFRIESISKRPEYDTICGWIPRGSRVLDLGCGDGSLLQMLHKKGVRGEGVELSPSGVKATQKKGFKATRGRIDQNLNFKNKSFDFSICNVTIQMVAYPDTLLAEMNRVSKYQIVSFPNFAFLVNRLEMNFLGRMPRFMLGGYKWYNTGHIHQFAVNDFVSLCKEKNYKITKSVFLGPLGHAISKLSPNLLSTLAVIQLT